MLLGRKLLGWVGGVEVYRSGVGDSRAGSRYGRPFRDSLWHSPLEGKTARTTDDRFWCSSSWLLRADGHLRKDRPSLGGGLRGRALHKGWLLMWIGML